MNEGVFDALAGIPPILRAEVEQSWGEIARRGLPPGAPSSAIMALPKVLGASRYVAGQCLRNPQLVQDLIGTGDIERAYGEGELRERAGVALATAEDERALAIALRRFRHREMVRIAWRDIGGLADLDATLRETSWLADALTDATLEWLYRDQAVSHGEPRDDRGVPQRLFVIAMGKLGGEELNFSSDIDLIYGYPRGGETGGGARSVSNQEFFDRLGRRLGKLLQEPGEEGFVFRVDMRLRPFGDSGALTQSVAAMESYYTTHARDWERYAMIKARICAGDRDAGEAFLKGLRPFVYRRYIDFGALQALREMKALINTEVARAELHDDVKRGRGGIREIEFIAQMFQLIRGGREPALRVRPTCEVLLALEALNELPARTVAELLEAYRFLRNTEHRLQQIDDQQTQTLPETQEDRARVALGMGFDSWQAFAAELARHRANVASHFARLLEVPESAKAASAPSGEDGGVDAIWSGQLSGEGAERVLAAIGFADPAGVLQDIDGLRAAPDIGRLSRHGQERMQRLLPMILRTVAGHAGERVALQRIFQLLETVARRSVYLALLAEQPQALRQLARLVAASPWIAGCIVRQPILLDELLDPRALYAPPSAAQLEQTLRNEIAKHPPEDLERQMEVLRHFRQAEVLRVAASDLTGHLPLPEVSNHLSWIAETVLRVALELAWRHLVDRHGQPLCGPPEARRPAGFAIVAYGKLGGLELGYGSDLDLVFLHDSAGEDQSTDGERPLDNATFFTRLGQRIIHLISTLTPAGVAYEVDTRLRPSGAAGLLVSSVEAYGKYQREQAWTWEHQALVRARFVGGHAAVGDQFEAIRREVLGRRRERATLRQEIIEMRARMRAEHASTEPGVFDLKQDPGGITDIEFMVQYGVLAYAADQPALLTWTDNKRLLEVFSDCGVMPATACAELCEAYFAMRHRIHRCALQEQPARVPDSEFREQRRLVTGLWREFLLDEVAKGSEDVDG
jgi:glutamate-ammonia-ligase adenylyltransferase